MNFIISSCQGKLFVLCYTIFTPKCKKGLNSNSFLPLIKFTSFPYYFSEKNVQNTSIDNISTILQAFKVVISVPTTEHIGHGLKHPIVVWLVFQALWKHIWGICKLYIFFSFWIKELSVLRDRLCCSRPLFVFIPYILNLFFIDASRYVRK